MYFLALLTAVTAVSVNALYYYGDQPKWTVTHSAPFLTTRLDPILAPGAVSTHVHSIVGSSSFAPVYSYDNSVAGQCTTGDVSVDLSSYWVPSMYQHNSSGFTLVPLIAVNTYYLMARQWNEPVYEFPPGFRMLSGSAERSTFNASDSSNQAIRYKCLDYSAPDQPETNAFPTNNCPDGLRLEVYFPSCWDGVNNWLEGSAHVAFPEGEYNSNGTCPTSHPKRLVGVFYEFIFQDDYDYVEGARVLATGDNVGYSLHGDFTNGWPEGFFQKIFDYPGTTCAVTFSVEDCPAIAPYHNSNNSCNPQGVIVDEDIGYMPIPVLPGNNPLWGGNVAKAVIPNYKDTGNFIQAAPEVPDGWNKVGCILEPSDSRALTAATTASPLMSPTYCMAYCASQSFSIAGVEYSDECYCGNSLTGTSLTDVLSDGTCDMPCAGQLYGKGFCGGASRLTVYQYIESGNPTVVNKTAPLIQPTGTGAPTQILASVIREDSVSGETGQTYTTYTVNGAASVAAPTTTTPGAVAMNGTGIMSSTTSGATASAMTPTAGSMNVSSSTNSSAEALSGVLLADPSGSSASTAAVVTSPVRGEKSCSRSRKRGL